MLDAELVAVDRADGNKLKAFQELSTRARGAITVDQVALAPSVQPVGAARICALLERSRVTSHHFITNICIHTQVSFL